MDERFAAHFLAHLDEEVRQAHLNRSPHASALSVVVAAIRRAIEVARAATAGER
jgi:hypothetical protein